MNHVLWRYTLPCDLWLKTNHFQLLTEGWQLLIVDSHSLRDTHLSVSVSCEIVLKERPSRFIKTNPTMITGIMETI